MDKLHDRLRDLIIYMNSNSNFDIYAVELEYYRHSDFEIIIPRLYGAEIKKEIKSPKKGLILTDDEILQEYAEVGMRKQIEDFLAVYNGVRTGALIIPGISITPGATKILAFIQTNDAYTQASINITPQRTPQIDVWTVQEKESTVARALEALGIEPVPMKKSSGKVGKIPLQSFDRSTFVAFLQAMGQA